MPFPPAGRVLYRKNPLERVICQLRFPPILHIEADPPVDFQDQIREDFPEFVESSGLGLDIPAPVSEQLPPEVLRQFIQQGVGKSYEFASQDGNWKVNLTRMFIALTTVRYERWEDFRRRLTVPLSALISVYSPSYFSRIGLRYTDVIRPSILGLEDRPWAALLSPQLIGMFGSSHIADSVERFESVHEIRLSETAGRVRIAAKLAKVQGAPDAFVIDSDYFDTTQIRGIDGALAKLDSFNRRSTRFMRWAILDELHEALEPTPL